MPAAVVAAAASRVPMYMYVYEYLRVCVTGWQYIVLVYALNSCIVYHKALAKWHKCTTEGFHSSLPLLPFYVNAYTLLFTFACYYTTAIAVATLFFLSLLSIYPQKKIPHTSRFFFFFPVNNYLLNFDVHKRLGTFSTQIDVMKIVWKIPTHIFFCNASSINWLNMMNILMVS